MSALRFPNSSSRTQTGFTLVELVTVIVLLSIIAVIGSSFVVNSADSYRKSTAHNQLVQQARQALERSSRELRHALPNSIRISSNKHCMEWLPVVGVGHYEGQVAGQTTTVLNTTPITISLAAADYLNIAGLSSDELYGSGPLTLARTLATLEVPLSRGSTVDSITMMGAGFIFPRDSVSRRVFLISQPKQLCVHGGSLTLHEGYTTGTHPETTLSGIPPANGTVLTQSVAYVETPFELEMGSEVRNIVVTLKLPLEQAGQRIDLQHKVMVRNVP